MQSFLDIERFIIPRSSLLRKKRKRLKAVTLQVGRDEPIIMVTVRTDGRVRLAFGTGEEFVGSWQDMPTKVSVAAQNLLDVATHLVGRLPQQDPDDTQGTARFAVQTTKAVYAEGSRITDLNDGHSHLSPLWKAFSELLSPLMTVLFRTSAASHRSHASDLIYAQGLWG